MPDFEYLLESTGPLNEPDSINACIFALQKGQNELVHSWLGEPGKLACTEEMGDAIKPFDNELALAVYLRAQTPHKVIQCYAETGQFDKIVRQSQTIGYIEDDYLYLLESILGNETAQQAVKLAVKLVSLNDEKSGNPILKQQSVIDVFVKANLPGPGVEFLSEILKTNNKSEGALQTQFFELHFAHDSVAAKQLLDSKKYTYYDRKKIAQLCEKYGFLRSAIEEYQSMADIRRVFASQEMAKLIETDGVWLQKYLASLKVADAVQCLESMLGMKGTDHDGRLVVAKLTAELYRKQFSKRNVVDTIHTGLNLDREILQYCEEADWQTERIQFLLRLKNTHLWSSSLTSGISTNDYFISEVASLALGSDPDQDAIQCLVQALIVASLSADLLTLLEALLFDSKLDNKQLKNLLLLTAIKLANVSDNKSRVMDYAMRLEGYDGIEVAKAAESQSLFEEAFAIYHKFGDKMSAMRILLEKIGDLDRARKFAEECNDEAVWALLPPIKAATPQDDILEKEPTPVIAAEPSLPVEENSLDQFAVAVITPVNNDDDQLHPVDTIVLPEAVSDSPPGEVILLSELAIKTPPLEMKSQKKLPPIKASMKNSLNGGSNNNANNKLVPYGFQLAEFASKVKIKQNARHVLQMTNDDIQRWLVEIGLGRYCDRFARYNGQMLDNLYSLHFTAPEFFCQSVNSKLDNDLDNVIIFFGALCRLYGDER